MTDIGDRLQAIVKSSEAGFYHRHSKYDNDIVKCCDCRQPAWRETMIHISAYRPSAGKIKTRHRCQKCQLKRMNKLKG